jgi:hypothetical protein
VVPDRRIYFRKALNQHDPAIFFQSPENQFFILYIQVYGISASYDMVLRGFREIYLIGVLIKGLGTLYKDHPMMA